MANSTIHTKAPSPNQLGNGQGTESESVKEKDGYIGLVQCKCIAFTIDDTG